MKKDKKYCCSLYNDKEMYNNAMFFSFDEAKQAGLEVIKEYNKNYWYKEYICDEDIFEDELINNFNGDTNNLSPVAEFYILEFERPEIPKNLGDDIISLIDESYWDEITFCYDENTMEKTLTKDNINELSKLIYDFLNKATGEYEYMIHSKLFTIEVGEND